MAKRKPTYERKIGIKHYLNRKLKPEIQFGIECYPVYIRITFEGQMTEIKSNWFHILDKEEQEEFLVKQEDDFFFSTYLSEDNFNNNDTFLKAFTIERNGIETIIRYLSNKYQINPVRNYQTVIYEEIAVNLYRFISFKAYEFYLKEAIFCFDNDLVEHVKGNSPDFTSCINALHKYFKEEIVYELENKNPKIRFISNLLNKIHDEKNKASAFKAYHIISPDKDTLFDFLNSDEVNYIHTLFDNWVSSKKHIN